MIIVRELPRDYEAIQFDEAFVAKYGLIKYPMLKRRKHSVYGDAHTHRHVTFEWMALSNNIAVCVGDGVVAQLDRERGLALMQDDQGTYAVHVPSTQKCVRKGRFGREVRETVYDCDAPELYEWIYYYYLGSTIVNNKDWIVTDSEGKSKVYAPDEFQKRFEVSDKNAGKEK